MPQMAPINWLFLFILFLMIFIIFNMMNYFIYTPLLNSTTFFKKKKKIMNWKW